RQLEYKQLWRGGQVLAVPPAYTDVNGARNILAAGHAVLACGEMVQSGRSLKQEPTEMIQATA
ncbi:transposase, partial [Escherichia coli]|nr:transposase [Escherichia coli]MCX3776666.1 transposase [Escherichia coli]